MTTVYVVPCGTSVLDQLGKSLSDAGSGGSKVSKFVNAVTKLTWLTCARDESDKVLTAWADKAAPEAEAARLGKAAPKKLSAETHSLAKRADLPGIRPGDSVVLLASDTDGGVSAAFCVAHYLARGDCAQIAYTSTPEDVTARFRLPAGEPAVTVVCVRGLKPNIIDFAAPVAGIGKVLRAVWDTGATVEVHLTGGFKATLLHTLAMSEVLHSLDPGRLSAWYVFEDVIDTNSDQPVAPVPIGLRAFLEEHIEDMQAELHGAFLGNVKVHDGSRMFEGTGWRPAGGFRKLTDFGYGYLAVLGTLSASLGDDNQ